MRIAVPAPCSTLVSFRKEPSPKRARRKDVKSNKTILLAFRRYKALYFRSVSNRFLKGLGFLPVRETRATLAETELYSVLHEPCAKLARGF